MKINLKFIDRFTNWVPRLRMNPVALAPFVIGITLAIAALALMVFLTGSMEIPQKESLIAVFSALIAVMCTFAVNALKEYRDINRAFTVMIITYITSFMLALFIMSLVLNAIVVSGVPGVGITFDWPAVSLESIIFWAISSFAAGIIVSLAAIYQIRLMSKKTPEMAQLHSLYAMILMLVASAAILIGMIAWQPRLDLEEPEVGISGLLAVFLLSLIAIFSLERLISKTPMNLRKDSFMSVILVVFIAVVALIGYDSVVGNLLVTTSEKYIMYGTAAAMAVALIAILFPIGDTIKINRELSGHGMPSTRRFLINLCLVSALVALFGFALYDIPPTGNALKFGILSAAIAGALLFYISIPLKEVLGHSKTEKLKLSITSMKRIWMQYKESRFGLFGLAVLIIVTGIAIIGPTIAPQNPLDLREPENLLPQPPSGKYWFGTDFEDKDVWSQFLWGARVSLIVGILAGLLSAIIGTAVGITSGYFGKIADEVLMRFTDFFLVIPWLPLMIVLIAILGRSFWVVIFVIGIVSWAPTARVVRAAVLSIKEKQYIERSIALGAGNSHIIFRHIFPNVFPLIVATSILLVAEAIFSEAFLDFFGLGDPNVVSWGWMLERAHQESAMMHWYWWWILPPALGIILLIMSFYIVGDTLDEILNPRLKRR